MATYRVGKTKKGKSFGTGAKIYIVREGERYTCDKILGIFGGADGMAKALRCAKAAVYRHNSLFPHIPIIAHNTEADAHTWWDAEGYYYVTVRPTIVR